MGIALWPGTECATENRQQIDISMSTALVQELLEKRRKDNHPQNRGATQTWILHVVPVMWKPRDSADEKERIRLYRTYLATSKPFDWAGRTTRFTARKNNAHERNKVKMDVPRGHYQCQHRGKVSLTAIINTHGFPNPRAGGVSSKCLDWEAYLKSGLAPVLGPSASAQHGQCSTS